MQKREYQYFLRDDLRRYSNTWTVAAEANDVYVTAPTFGGTSVVKMESNGLCQFLFTPLSEEFAPFAHIPPCKVDSWFKKEVEFGLFKLLDIHMPHNLLSDNVLYSPSPLYAYPLAPKEGYDVTTIALFESRDFPWNSKYLESYEWIISIDLPDGRFVHIMTYGSFLTFPEYPDGDEEVYIPPANRLVAAHVSEEEQVGYLVDAMLNEGTLRNVMKSLGEIIDGLEGQ